MKKVIDVLALLLTHIDLEDDDEDSGFYSSILGLFESFALNLPKNKVYKIFMSNVQNFIESNDEKKNCVGISILSRII